MVVKINLDKTVYELCTMYPDIKTIMSDIGFDNITKPGMLETLGKIMTIPKGCRVKRIHLDDVIQKLNEHGYTIEMEGEK